MYSLLFFGCRHHIGPVFPRLLPLPSPVSSSPSSFPFICFFFYLVHLSQPFLSLDFFFFHSYFLSLLSALRKHTSLSAQNSLFLLLLSFSCSVPLSIHPTLNPLSTLPQPLPLSLVSRCCGLCRPSLSEMLSLLSVSLVRTKSSTAHGITKDNKEPQPKREAERSKN